MIKAIQMLFTICALLLMFCNNKCPIKYVNKAIFEVSTTRYNSFYYQSWILTWYPLEEEPIIQFNGKIGTKNYLPNYGMYPIFGSDSFDIGDTMNYSILYLGEKYNGTIIIGDTLPNILCNGRTIKINFNGSNIMPTTFPKSRDTVIRAQNYEFAFNENALYYISMQVFYDTNYIAGKWIDTLISSDNVICKFDNVKMVDMLVVKYRDYSKATFQPKYSGNSYLIYQNTEVDKKNLYLFIKYL